MDMFIFLYTVFRNSSISDEHVFCVALHFTTERIYLVVKVPIMIFFALQNRNIICFQNND
ncbi:hypothetical protein F1711_08705 [Streptococcus pneumoniae]|nr:hypothetical protein F1711_08705 [Streptococcus pneumoniae]KAA3418927.1 hypothetical protein F1715_08160 [Streptococcus pneumoniae]KAA3423015.1 hypothetical protein F1714_08870 [Streptococcus pneumoniae]KAA3428177.1 hypothetical protein F1713_08720 [Streptococcus pneumoniae]TLP50335.1 hypothetical protein FE139_08850 [Streptococcus pneumoniae]